MATMEVRLRDAMTRIATEVKAVRTLMNGNAADNAALTTTAKASLVAAINELQAEILAMNPAQINDAVTALTSVWSSTKVNDEITSRITAIINGAPGALDTLDEIAAALGDDANFATTITTALANRVRHDTAAQGLTTLQKSNARTNIDAYGSVEIGNPDTNFVTVFEAGLT